MHVLRREGVHPRASLCLSVGSFLLSACALLVAIRSTTHGGAMSELSSPLNFVPMLMTLIGEIDESGTVLRGMGFSSKRLNTGEYAVTFTKPFDSPPAVVAVAQQYAICYLPRQALGPIPCTASAGHSVQCGGAHTGVFTDTAPFRASARRHSPRCLRRAG